MTALLPLETIVRQLDALNASIPSIIIGLGPPDIDSTIEGLLTRIGEALDVDEVMFESFTGDPAGRRGARAWMRPGSRTVRAPTLSVPVVVEGRLLGKLAIGYRAGAQTWPEPLVDRLQCLASLVVVTIQHSQLMLELARTRSKGPLGNTVRATRADDSDFEDIIGDSPALRVAMARLQEVAPTDATVVLLGETGTGKELFAKAVHNRSARRGYPFIAVNCAALPPTLIESELFGHERGAFTGATALRRGRFELAHKGTLFLDEIGDLPPDVQAKLLRALQEGEFERVGSSQTHKVDARLIAATHHNLEEAVKEGRFRPDLYYRLNVFPIALPPLRERAEDIPRLAWFFINSHQRALNRCITSIPPAVLDALQRHSWPGNVRELENVIERAMIHSTGDALSLDEGPGIEISSASEDIGTLEAVERRHIENALRRCRWRINGAGNAAEALGLHPNTLRFRMKKLGIQRPANIGLVRDFRRPA